MKPTLVLVFCLFSSVAHAEKWVKTYGNEMAVEYVDIDSVQISDSKATANFKRDYIDGVDRKSQDASNKFFSFVQSRSVMSFECAGNRHSYDQVWDVSADGKTRSVVKSYPMSQNNDTWDAAAKKAVCR